jgi:hypothetical protein
VTGSGAVGERMTHPTANLNYLRDTPLAAANLSSDRLSEYAAAQREAFAKANHLRSKLAQAGLLRAEEDSAASTRYRYGALLDKRPFIEGAHSGAVMGWTTLGQAAAALEQERICDALAAFAEVISTRDAIAAAVEVIATMRAAGLPPDAVLIPNRAWVRPLLRRHPDFRFAGAAHKERRELGYLSEAPVFDVARQNADYLLVVNFEGALQLVEKFQPGQPAPLRVDVLRITTARAAKLIDERHVHGWESAWTKEALIRHLTDENVECFVDIDYRISRGARGAVAAKRITLGPESRRAPTATA